MSRRGRRVALGAGVMGIIVLVATGYAFRGRVVEEYWLWKLDHGDDAARQKAAVRLGGMKSTKAIPYLVRVLCDSWASYSWEDPIPEIYEKALYEIGKEALPIFVSEVGKLEVGEELSITLLREYLPMLYYADGLFTWKQGWQGRRRFTWGLRSISMDPESAEGLRHIGWHNPGLGELASRLMTDENLPADVRTAAEAAFRQLHRDANRGVGPDAKGFRVRRKPAIIRIPATEIPAGSQAWPGRTIPGWPEFQPLAIKRKKTKDDADAPR